MSLFKKALLFFLALPLLFIVSSFVAGQKSALAATCSQAPTLSLDTSVSPNPKDNPLNKVYTLKINNPNSTNCTYKLKASSIITNWTFLFHPVNNEATTLLNSEITVPQAGCTTALCNEKRQFKVRATPQVLPQPGTTNKFKVEIVGTNISLLLNYVVPPTTTTRDLVITTFNFPGGVDTGTSNPTITIKNIGNAQITGNFNVKVENKENHSGASQVWAVTQTVSAGESISHTFTNMPRPSAGTYTALAKVDSGNAISESNENNNTAIDTYTTTRPPTCDKNALLEVTEPQSGERSGKRGEERKYTIKITNRDSGNDCNDETIFVLTKEGDLPRNFNFNFDDSTLKIAMGDHKSTVFHATPQNDATLGRKTIMIRMKRQGTNISKTLNVFYIVEPNNPTPTPTRRPTPTPTGRPINSPTPSNCVRVTPEMTITQDKNSVNPGGGTITYTVEVKNVDQGSCPERTMNLTRDLHNDNWRGPWDPNNDISNFAIGQTRTKKLAVTSPDQAPVGTYKVKINLRNNTNEVVNSQEVDFIISDTPVTPTPTLTPSGEPTPTIFPDNGLLKVKLGVDGIGKTPRIPIGGNQNPIDPDKNFTLGLYSTSTNTLIEGWDDWTFTYNTTSQKFENELGLSNDFPTGTYNAYIEGGGYIRARYPGSVTITKGQTTVIDSDNFYVITGNLNNEDTSENRIDIMDYMVLTSCWIYSQDYSLCDQNPNYKILSDLNNDGIVNEDDYTLFLKEYGNEGAPLP